MLVIKNIDINLKDTITCGQIFRYYIEEDNSYTVILSDRVVNLKMDNNDLIVKSNNYDNLEIIIKDYLDLNTDYNKINKKIIKNNKDIKQIVESCSGLKMINQPKFECAISYIISQNNRVPQISKALNNISKKYGEKVIFENKEYYLFPSLDKLTKVSEEDFRKLKVGFRDEYLCGFISKLNNNEINLDYIDTLSSEDALKYLMKIKGIGEKVASCILVFSYSRYDVYPIDTWVKKYMLDKYQINNVRDIKNYTKEKYDKYSGLVIQYMFHYKRNKEN